MESALLARGFHYGSAPDSVVIGWNSGHAAVTLPDGTPVSSGESNHGVRVGGGGAYQPQFSHHMYLPVAAQEKNEPAAAPAEPGVVELAAAPAPTAEGVPGPMPADAPAPAEVPSPAPDGAVVAPVAAEAQAPIQAPAPVDAAPGPVDEHAPVEAPGPVEPAAPAGELPPADPAPMPPA